MNKKVTVPLCCVLWGTSVRAELDLLTLREAQAIVERIPSVVAARKNGECPQLSATYAGAEEFWIAVRGGCGPSGGMLIDNYAISRRTGDVTTWGDDPKPVFNPNGEALARQLIKQARGRVLSLGEARCLASEAAKSLPGWSEKGSKVLVRPFGRPDASEAQFTALHRSAQRPVESGRLLTVSRSTVRVRDDETGMNLMSAGLGALAAKLLAMRIPPWLTDEDAAVIALQIPEVAARVPDGCRLYAGGVFNFDVVEAGASCDGQPRGRGVKINLHTGQVVDAENEHVLESPQAKRLARQILDDREMQLSMLRKEIEATCREE